MNNVLWTTRIYSGCLCYTESQKCCGRAVSPHAKNGKDWVCYQLKSQVAPGQNYWRH